jgi:hypothetical protein
MKDTLSRKVAIPKGARRKVYYDTQPLKQNKAKVNFFPPQASRDIPSDNYIQNPFSGDNARLVYGLTFALTSQYIHTDTANSIDAEAIINAVKDAGLVANADQDYKEFLRVPFSDHFNFEGTHLNIAVALAGQASADDQQATVSKTVTAQDHETMYRVADPFVIAKQQNMNLYVEFNDASVFPTEQNWKDAGQQQLHLQCKLDVAELIPSMQA